MQKKKEKKDELMPIYHKYFIMKAFIFAMILYVLLVFVTVNKPLTVDEASFGKEFKNVYKYGFSAYGMTSEDSYQYKNLVQQLSHPPLWQIVLYFHTFIFGMSNLSIRLFGVITYFLSLILVYKILNKYNSTSADKLFLLSATLLLIHQYLAIASMAVHIDTMFIPLIFLLFAYYFIKTDIKTWKDYMLLIILYAIAFWTKELLVAFITLSLFIYYIYHKKYKDAFKNTFIITFFGSIIFLITWIIFALAYGIPVEGWFYETVWKKVVMLGFQKDAISLFAYLMLIITRFFWKVIFYNIAILTLIFIGIWYNFKNKNRNIKFDFLHIFIIIQFIAFTFYFYMNTYYLFTAVFVGIIIIAQLIYEKQIKISKKHIYLLLGLFIYYLAFLNPAIKIQRYWLLTENMKTLFVFPQLYIILIYLFFYFLPYLLITTSIIIKKIKIEEYIRLLIILFLASSAAFNIYQLQDYTTATLWNNYGEEGFSETLVHLNSMELIANTTIITRKDFEYYLLEKFEENDIHYVYNYFMRNKMTVTYEKNMAKINLSEVSIITTDMYISEKYKENLTQNFRLEYEYGDFQIYVNPKYYN